MGAKTGYGFETGRPGRFTEMYVAVVRGFPTGNLRGHGRRSRNSRANQEIPIHVGRLSGKRKRGTLVYGGGMLRMLGVPRRLTRM